MQDNLKFFSGPFFYVIGFVSFIHLIWILGLDGGIANLGLRDGDSYLRLVHVERLIETLNWFDNTVPRSNAPFGTTVHWTRLFDLVLLSLTAPLLPFMEFSKALYWVGLMVSPVLHVFLAGTIVWAVTPVIGRQAALLAGGLSFTQAGIMNYAIAGNADHHIMLLLVSVVIFGYALRVLEGPAENPLQSRACYSLGLLFGLGVWASPEILLMIFVCLLGTSIYWLFGKGGGATLNLKICGSFFVSTGLFLLIDKGFEGFLTVENDRISIIHVVLSAVLFLFWICVQRWSNLYTSLLSRIIVAGAGVTFLSAVMVTLFPVILNNPMHSQGGLFQELSKMTSELHSITNSPNFLIFGGSILFVGPFLIGKLLSSSKKWQWGLIFCATLFYVVLSFHWLRWSLYMGMFFTIAISSLIFSADKVISVKLRFPVRLPLKVIVILLIIFGPQFSGIFIRDTNRAATQQNLTSKVECPVRKMSEFLGKPPWGDRSRIILSSANFGAELLYRTKHQVIATVQHRTPDGILDGYSIFNASNPDKYRALIQKRSVDLIVVCPNSIDDLYFLYKSSPDSLYRLLMEDQYITRLRKVDLPPHLYKSFKLYETIRLDKTPADN